MQQHALRTALTLYADGTLSLETAARRAGVTPDRLRRAAARRGRDRDRDPTVTDTERVTVGAD
jgi:predicted HTH domain antitoxin